MNTVEVNGKPEAVTGIVWELRRLLATTSEETPYCVLSRQNTQVLLEILTQQPADNPLLEEVEKVLTPIEFRLYKTLYQAQGMTVLSEELLQRAGTKTESSLWVHVRRLRLKLEAKAKQWGVVETVRERGYFLSLAA